MGMGYGGVGWDTGVPVTSKLIPCWALPLARLLNQMDWMGPGLGTTGLTKSGQVMPPLDLAS